MKDKKPFGRKPRGRKKREFDQVLVDVARVARVMAGGRRFRFRVTVVIGNRKGRVGLGVAKGPDVTTAANKAVNQAKKNMVNIPMLNGTIPHEARVKYRGAVVFLKPAPPGTGIIAGGSVRAVSELAGIKDILSKMQGSANKVNNVKATMLALEKMKMPAQVASKRGKDISEVSPFHHRQAKVKEAKNKPDSKSKSEPTPKGNGSDKPASRNK